MHQYGGEVKDFDTHSIMDLLALSSSKFTSLNHIVGDLASLIDLIKLSLWNELAIGFLRNGSGSGGLYGL